VHDLVDGVAQVQQLVPVRRRRDADLGQRARVPAGRTGNPPAFRHVARFFGLERARQLLQEHRDAVGQLLRGGGPEGPERDLAFAAGDEFFSVVGQEKVHSVRDGGSVDA